MPFKLKVHFTAPLTTREDDVPGFRLHPESNQSSSVARIELVGEDGREIRGEVHLDSVEIDRAMEIAKRASDAALDRIAYHHDLSIGGARIGPCQIISPPPGVHLHAIEGGDTASFGGEAAAPVLPVDPSDLKAELEKALPPGGRYFGLYRSALLSTGYVERFMHLYNILLMLPRTSGKVDQFILKEREATPRMSYPGIGSTPQMGRRRRRRRFIPGSATSSRMSGRMLTRTGRRPRWRNGCQHLMELTKRRSSCTGDEHASWGEQRPAAIGPAAADLVDVGRPRGRGRRRRRRYDRGTSPWKVAERYLRGSTTESTDRPWRYAAFLGINGVFGGGAGSPGQGVE